MFGIEPCAGRASPPPPIFDDRRAAADNLSALRRCHVRVFNYFVAFSFCA